MDLGPWSLAMMDTAHSTTGEGLLSSPRDKPLLPQRSEKWLWEAIFKKPIFQKELKKNTSVIIQKTALKLSVMTFSYW